MYIIKGLYQIGVTFAICITPIWFYFYHKRLQKKWQLVDIIFVPILATLSWFWLYCMYWIFMLEDQFELKTLGMPKGE